MKKKKEEAGGAPEWALTYGDLMSLLLVFFIMLVAVSTIRKPEEAYRQLAGIKAAFQGWGGAVSEHTIIQIMEELKKRKQMGTSNAEDPGTVGPEESVTTIREGLRFETGGRITFEPGSADLSEEVKQTLIRVAKLLSGIDNVIELRGHAAPMELVESSIYPDLDSLCFARAQAVKEYLVREEMGIRPERLRLVSAADNEPLVQRVYTAEAQQLNRRVEVLCTESLARQRSRPEGADRSELQRQR